MSPECKHRHGKGGLQDVNTKHGEEWLQDVNTYVEESLQDVYTMTYKIATLIKEEGFACMHCSLNKIKYKGYLHLSLKGEGDRRYSCIVTF